MELRLGLIVLGSSDLERSLAFYHDVLGLPVKARFGPFILLETGASTLAISSELAPPAGEAYDGFKERIAFLNTPAPSTMPTGPSTSPIPTATIARPMDRSNGLVVARWRGEMEPLADSIETAIRERMRSIPIFSSLGFSDVRLGAGAFASTVARNQKFDGIFDSFHGGLLMTAADSAAAIVALTVWGGDARITTTDMNIRFLAPARSDVYLVAEAIKRGRTLLPVAANVWRDDGTLVAVAHVTYMRLT